MNTTEQTAPAEHEPEARAVCEHFYASHCYRGMSIRLCMTCGDPDWGDLAEQLASAARGSEAARTVPTPDDTGQAPPAAHESTQEATGAVLTDAQCDRVLRMVADHENAVRAVKRALHLAEPRIDEHAEIIEAGWTALKVLSGEEEAVASPGAGTTSGNTGVSLGGPGDHVACDTAIAGLRSQAEAAEALVLANALELGTSCTRCAATLDLSATQTFRAAVAEARLRQIRDLVEAGWPGLRPSTRLGSGTAVQRILAIISSEEEAKPDVGKPSASDRVMVARATGGDVRSREVQPGFSDECEAPDGR